jgi:hypothetical protein
MNIEYRTSLLKPRLETTIACTKHKPANVPAGLCFKGPL